MMYKPYYHALSYILHTSILLVCYTLYYLTFERVKTKLKVSSLLIKGSFLLDFIGGLGQRGGHKYCDGD